MPELRDGGYFADGFFDHATGREQAGTPSSGTVSQEEKRQDVSQRRKEKDHQAVPFCPGRSHFSCRKDDALLAHRNP
ncbi:hypothetical protein Q8A67_010955 [Cirrhinus molitorella]|uniref:Uncharacterized protein n=1 Tax=Cirrhinus molitorella TaxID=172907 RepID=A0AA88TP44_9TELE|nr:hypothetical protein Q8A67_010955 [Cirrhinus molitorella]